MTTVDLLVAKIPQFEGSVPFMYLDTTGHVTVGIGNMLPTVQAALALPFMLSGQAACPEIIQGDWKRITGMPYGLEYAAHYYDSDTSPILSDPVIADLLTSYVTREEGYLAAAFPTYAKLPQNWQLALLDMAYNLGVHGLLGGYPHLMAGVEDGNWQVCMSQCNRPQVSIARNNWVRSLFVPVGWVG